jgi:hypothetical protein
MSSWVMHCVRKLSLRTQSWAFSNTNARCAELALTKQPQEPVAEVFQTGNTRALTPPMDVKVLHPKVRRFSAGERFFGRRAQQGVTAERKTMIIREHALPVRRQIRLVGIVRSRAYHPAPGQRNQSEVDVSP